MNWPLEHLQRSTRRAFFADAGLSVGSIALASLLGRRGMGGTGSTGDTGSTTSGTASANALDGVLSQPHHAAKAKSVIFLFMAGGPSQLELFEDKPLLRELSGQSTPASFLEGRRFAFLKGSEKLLGPNHTFARYGKSGAVLSDLLPHHRAIADDVCFIKSMHTDVFNHGPAKIFLQTGSPQPGRPSIGSWVTYGIGSEADDLPGFVVLQSGPRGPRGGSALWSSGFLPTNHQGVPFRGSGDPILNLQSPPGIDREAQKAFTEAVAGMNALRHAAVGDPEIETRIAAYEMAYRMQSSAPELMDISAESQETLDLYGAVPGKPSFSNNALLARRLVERGVRFVQLYHTNWDQHGGEESLEKELPLRCREVDEASAALVLDLKRRGLLDETLVIWGGEFGRTPMGETRKPTGRDHHVDSFTIWMAGGGVRPGVTYGATDELGFAITENPVHVHDLQATILHLLGIDHERLTFRFQGRDFRLTDVHGHVVNDVLA